MSARNTKIAVVNRIKYLRTVSIRSLSNLGFSQFLELDPKDENWPKEINKDTVIILEFPDPKNPELEMECLNNLRRREETKNHSIIVTVTATGIDKKFVMSIISRGVKDFILKSNDVSALSKRFEKALEKMIRKFKRTRFETPLNVYDDEMEEIIGRMQDITVGGFMIECEKPMEAEREYSVNVELPVELNGKSFLTITANCRWCKNEEGASYKAGFMLKDLDEDDKAIIEILVRDYCTVDI